MIEFLVSFKVLNKLENTGIIECYWFNLFDVGVILQIKGILYQNP